VITQVKFRRHTDRDQDRALKFYTEKLGFEVSTEPGSMPATLMSCASQLRNARRALYPRGHESRIGSFFNGSFACDDVGATYRQLKARESSSTSLPRSNPGAIRDLQRSRRQSIRAVFGR